MSKGREAIKKVKPVVLGFDISSSIIGITAIEVETGRCVFVEPIIIAGNEELEDIIDKAEFFEQKLDELLNKYSVEVKDIGFENFAQKFSKGGSSIHTILTLARFNGLVDFLIWKKFGIKSKKLNVLSIRKKTGIATDKKIGDIKEQILKQVMSILEKENFAPWIYTYPTRGKNKGKPTPHKCNFDMADSWVVAKATWLAYRTDA